jgi:hypothetical protein
MLAAAERGDELGFPGARRLKEEGEEQVAVRGIERYAHGVHRP